MISSREMPMSLSASSPEWLSSSVVFNNALCSARRRSQSRPTARPRFIIIGVLPLPAELQPQRRYRSGDASVTLLTPPATSVDMLVSHEPMQGHGGLARHSSMSAGYKWWRRRHNPDACRCHARVSGGGNLQYPPIGRPYRSRSVPAATLEMADRSDGLKPADFGSKETQVEGLLTRGRFNDPRTENASLL